MANLTWGEFEPSPALSSAILAVLAGAALGDAVPLVIRLRQAPRDSIVAISADNWPDHEMRMVIHTSTFMPAALRERYETSVPGTTTAARGAQRGLGLNRGPSGVSEPLRKLKPATAAPTAPAASTAGSPRPQGHQQEEERS